MNEASWPAQPYLVEAPHSHSEARKQLAFVASHWVPYDDVDAFFRRYSYWFALRRAVLWFQIFCRWIANRTPSHSTNNVTV